MVRPVHDDVVPRRPELRPAAIEVEPEQRLGITFWSAGGGPLHLGSIREANNHGVIMPATQIVRSESRDRDARTGAPNGTAALGTATELCRHLLVRVAIVGTGVSGRPSPRRRDDGECVTVRIQLFGRPCVVREGTAIASRGRKVWALLAYLVCVDRPVSRERLAALLFDEADDPFGALRWNLTEARRLLGVPGALGGEPLALDLPAGVVVDVHVLTRGTWAEAMRLPNLAAPLLEGLSFPANAIFETWLTIERRHLAGRFAAVLRQATLTWLAVGDATAALRAARGLAELDPLDENAHVLLVRSLEASGDHPAASAQAAASVALLSRELGVRPSGAIEAELAASLEPVSPASRSGVPAARALLDAGVAAVDAGAADVGLERLRGAVIAARANDATEIEVRALCELGSALINAVRGRDEAGAASLHQAIAIAEDAAQPVQAIAACRELGYCAFLRARYPEAHQYLDRAESLAAGEPAELTAVSAIRGASFTDTGHYKMAFDELARARRSATAAGSSRWEAWVLTMVGRAHLLREELEEARGALNAAIA